jgi:hypothetical protein
MHQIPFMLVLQLLTVSVAGAEDPLPSGEPPPGPAETVKRVPYLPETLRAQIREEIKKEVLEQAKAEGWATPGAQPEWTKRLRFKGDVRARYESVQFQPGNATGWYWDFNAINTGKPLDVNPVDYTADRFLNVDKDRTRPRLRARLGLDADLKQGFSVQLRLASGDGATPVSTNQTLGGAGGNFSKYQVWIDRAALRYEPWQEVLFEVGRFENPFMTTELTWDEDVNLDGLAVQARLRPRGSTPFFTAGAFPVFNSAFDVAPDHPIKYRSRDKWLYAAQAGYDWRPSERYGLKVAAAFYWFNRIEGRVGFDCDTNISSSNCDTDQSRPSFAQKGNTYMTLRTPSDRALQAEAGGNTPRYQYFGLASLFREVVTTIRFDTALTSGLKLTVDGEFVRNVGFHGKELKARAQSSAGGGEVVNNFGACASTDPGCLANPTYGGGRMGYLARLAIGSPSMTRRWDWSAALSYRYLETDAAVDAFTDSDLGLGGTNVKGYVVSGSVAVGDNVAVGIKWLSSDAVVGPQYSVDILQLDLNGKF